jgi:hypothetical protein
MDFFSEVYFRNLFIEYLHFYRPTNSLFVVDFSNILRAILIHIQFPREFSTERMARIQGSIGNLSQDSTTNHKIMVSNMN